MKYSYNLKKYISYKLNFLISNIACLKKSYLIFLDQPVVSLDFKIKFDISCCV